MIHFIVLCLKESYAKVRFLWNVSPLSPAWWHLLLVASCHLLSCFVTSSKVLPYQSCPLIVHLFIFVTIRPVSGLVNCYYT